jgi:hypothetical protein
VPHPYPSGLLILPYRASSNLYSDRSIAEYRGACQTLPVTTEENIRALSRRVTDAPENSEEFRAVVDKLRANLKARAARERERVAALQRALPPSEDAQGETLFGG